MILIAAMLSILVLILAVFSFHLVAELKREREKSDYFKSQWEAEKAKTKPKQSEPELTSGAFVKVRKAKTASAETYRNLFDYDVDGQRVIDDLQRRFASSSTYVRGGLDAERESCFKAGQASVIGFIFTQINRANDPENKENLND